MAQSVPGKYLTKKDVKGIVLGVRQVQDRGRVQIPREAREKLKLADGDHVYWMDTGEIIYIMKATLVG